MSDLRSANRSPPPYPSEPFSPPSLVPGTFLSENRSKDSVGLVCSTLRPPCGNVRYDDGMDFEVSDVHLRRLQMGYLSLRAKENAQCSTFHAQRPPPSSASDLEELRLDNASPVSSDMSLTSIASSLAQDLDRGKLLVRGFARPEVAIRFLILASQSP